jgi:hypothetical protein
MRASKFPTLDWKKYRNAFPLTSNFYIPGHFLPFKDQSIHHYLFLLSNSIPRQGGSNNLSYCSTQDRNIPYSSIAVCIGCLVWDLTG